jgi:hypothetical protein
LYLVRNLVLTIRGMLIPIGGLLIMLPNYTAVFLVLASSATSYEFYSCDKKEHFVAAFVLKKIIVVSCLT